MFLFRENDRVDEFIIVRRLEKYTDCETYLAKDSTHGTVADLRVRCVRAGEYRPGYDAAPALVHRNVCRFIAMRSFESGGSMYIYTAVEHVPWKSLAEHIRAGMRLSQSDLMQIMTALLGALDSMEWPGSPVVHNAVNPGNILIRSPSDLGDLKLTGFGSAQYEALGPVPASGSGDELYYAAPERLDGGGSVRSDVFSAGAVMYWLVYGFTPWHTDLSGKTAAEQERILRERRKGPLPICIKRLIDVDDRLTDAMAIALQHDPEQRFAGAGEFLDALLGRIEVPSWSETSRNSGAGAAWKSRAKSAAGVYAGAKADVSRGKAASCPRRGNGFADVAGMEDIKDLMRRKIINVLKNPERAEKFRIQIPNGMLLYGPPGCGKSFIAEKFAEEPGWNYKLVKSSDLACQYIHGSQEKIGALFDEARKNAPVILNFDEFDALVPDRSRIDNVSISGEVNEFLSQMNNCGKDRVFVIASSNRPDLIDPAVRRKGRLDQMIYIPVPDAAAREGMFRVQMKGRPQEEGIDFSRLASLTENYVAADIAFIVNDAAETAFEEDDAVITERILEDAVRRTAPSVGADDIRHYGELRKKIDKSAKEGARSRIGFISE